MNHHSPAPTGHDVKAQGNALGMRPIESSSPERAKHRPGRIHFRAAGFRPSGRGRIFVFAPRALPWAITLRPVGASPGTTFSAPTGHHVKAQGNVLGMVPNTFLSPERA